jgi:hypothetical protein
MTEDLVMRRGDLMPDLVIDLEDRGVVLPLSSAVSVSVIASRNGVMTFKRTATIDEDEAVRMQWLVGDTATPGTYVIEVEAMWPGAKPQTIRTDNKVRVLPDLG